MLSYWFNDDKDPLFVLVAIGGMGKSSLAWYWLNNEVDRLSLDGIFWWSFYEGEASFTRFLNDAIIYTSGGETDPINITSNYDKSHILLQLLQQHRFLFILDGFERLLGTYNNAREAVHDQEDLNDDTPNIRACVDPYVGRFLCDLTASNPKSKIIITSRMRIYDLEDAVGNPIEGCQEKELKSFNSEDALSFMRSQGVTIGTKKEILDACSIYGNHPLSLRLLSGTVARNPIKPGDISIAPRYDINVKLKARRHHILKVAFEALPEDSKRLLSIAASFRSTIKYDAIYLFNESHSDLEFEDTLNELVDWGLLLFNKEIREFDLHPIVRRYAYDQLNDKNETHAKLRDYYSTGHPSLKKLKNLNELAPVIDFYYHTAKAGNLDEAKKIYEEKLSGLLFYQFGAYQTIIELLHILVPDGKNRAKRLQKEKDRGDVLQDLGNAYLALGQTRLAESTFNCALDIFNKHGNKIDRLVTRINVSISRLKMGDLKQAEADLQFPKRHYSEAYQAVILQEQGRLLAFKGQFSRSESLMNNCLRLFKKLEMLQSISITFAFEASLYLLMKRPKEACDLAIKALTYWEKLTEKTGPYEKDRIRAEWLIGLSLIEMASQEADMREKRLQEAEGHLKEAFVRCHRINLVDFEPSILLTWGKWYYSMNNSNSARKYAEEALYIANRCEYRLDQAEIHNFLAQLYFNNDIPKAIQHAQTAYKCAYCDGPSHCYKPALDIAEDILKKLGANLFEN